MPADPFTLIAQYESTYNPTAKNPNSSASGLFGDLNSTWSGALQAIGVNPSTYPTAASAPASVQFAANAYLLNTQGFSPWTCPGCDAQLTRALAASGGPSAYNIGNLSTNPADYASLDSVGALGQYFAQNGADGGSFVGVADISGSGGQAPSVGSSMTTNPFQYTYSSLIDGVTGQVDTAAQATQQLVYPYLVVAMTIAVAFLGLRVLAGRFDINEFMSFALRATIVGALLSPDGQHFIDWIQGPIQQFPTSIASAFGVPTAGPAAIFDDAAHALNAITNTIQSNIPVSLRGLGNVIFTDALWLIGIGSLMVMFAPFLIATFLLLLLIVISRAVIIFGLFKILTGWVKGYADVVAGLALVLLAIDVVVVMIEGIIIAALNGFTPGGSSQTDMASFGTLIIVLVAIAVSLKYMAPVVARIFGGISLPLEGAAAWAGRQVVRR